MISPVLLAVACLHTGAVDGAGLAALAADLPTRDRRLWLAPAKLPLPPQAACLTCPGWVPPSEWKQRAARSTPFLTIYNLVLRLDEYLLAQGLQPPPTARTSELRLWLISPSPLVPAPGRQPQDVESLNLYVLELGDLGIVGTARQQGRGGFWGELFAGQRVQAQIYGFLPQRGSNATGADWFATHLLQVSLENLRLHPSSPRGPYVFLSVENDLTRDAERFSRVSVLPGFGIAMAWQLKTQAKLTLSSGFNSGAWFDFQTGRTFPGFSVTLQNLRLHL